jgi:hypothetical protein
MIKLIGLPIHSCTVVLIYNVYNEITAIMNKNILVLDLAQMISYYLSIQHLTNKPNLMLLIIDFDNRQFQIKCLLGLNLPNVVNLVIFTIIVLELCKSWRLRIESVIKISKSFKKNCSFAWYEKIQTSKEEKPT